MTAKQFVLETVERLDDELTLSQILEEIAIQSSIRKGLEDVNAGRVVPHEEVKRRMASWFSE